MMFTVAVFLVFGHLSRAGNSPVSSNLVVMCKVWFVCFMGFDPYDYAKISDNVE